jgi:hypothetical protein
MTPPSLKTSKFGLSWVLQSRAETPGRLTSESSAAAPAQPVASAEAPCSARLW